jgi:thiol:disulfide interchange protein DsbA
MSAWRGRVAAVLAVLGLCLASGAGAADLKEGRDFRTINPPLAADWNRIEVTEFFWYGCPHCFDFEQVLVPWAGKLPADVVFRRVPAVFPNNKWTPGARLYYTLEAMNLLDRLHGEVFNAIHLERKRLDNEKALFEWVATKGVDTGKFSEAWSSFGVESRVRHARELTMAAGLGGVPAMVVHGRYQAITPGTYGELITLIDRLIDGVRAETGRK